jgi:ATP-dependent Clp protease ATP-binding subunit ClpC
VLLDEFEKAAAPILDLFLQVFDDGRLTDRTGRVADFRRCVFVLTSNVGSSIATGRGLGFAPSREPFRPEKVEDALRNSFRPELLNRIDRVVVFRPFERAQMRALLDKELAAVLARRGVRGRPWAMEVDEGAYEFLIRQGFSPEFGARPLRRAVERHLLAPLAAAIVEGRVPEGDQFLLVSAPRGDRIEVAFVNPDAEPPEPEDESETSAQPEPRDVRVLARAPEADPATTGYLLDELGRVAAQIRGDGVDARKHAALAAVNEPGFWERDDRFVQLAEVEYLDRLETALETAVRLGERLARYAGRNGERRGRELVSLLAIRLHVLESALRGLAEGTPYELFLEVRPASKDPEGAARFADELARMYAQWAERRGMRLEALSADAESRLFAVSGLGCGFILLPEAGLHVLEPESEAGRRDVDRFSALVRVAGRNPGPETGRETTAGLARQVLGGEPTTAAVVRRYRRKPAPLVRDAVRGYRTGRLDRVLAGDFDLF